LLYCRAQAAAAAEWLSQGLHAGFRCQLATLEALPLHSSSSSSSSSDAGLASNIAAAAPGAAGRRSGRAGSMLWRSASIAANRSSSSSSLAAGKASQQGTGAGSSTTAAAAAAATYRWSCEPNLGWGSTVPLPKHWCELLTAEEAEQQQQQLPDTPPAAAAAAAVATDVTLQDLMCRADLPQGPQALLVTFSTPYGLARATITPQIVRAAYMNSECRQVLAVPVDPGSTTNSSSSSSSIGGSGSRGADRSSKA
jgi:hypothetical protein